MHPTTLRIPCIPGNRRLALPLLVTALALSACATVTTGTHQTVTVETPGVADAQCVVHKHSFGPVPVNSAGVVTVPRNGEPLTVTCHKEGFEPAWVTLEPHIDSHALVELPFGYFVDYMSGARYRYANSVSVTLLEKSLASR